MRAARRCRLRSRSSVSCSASASWWMSGNGLWLLGALAMIAPWPWTLLAIMPINHTLESLDPTREGGTQSRAVADVGQAARRVGSALGVAATLIYLAASLR